MKILNLHVLNAVSSSASANSAAVDASQMVSFGIQSIFSDMASTGTVKIQASNDIPPVNYNTGFVPTNWSDIPNQSATVTAGVAPLLTVNQSAYRFIRVVFTRSAGAGTITVNLFGLCL